MDAFIGFSSVFTLVSAINFFVPTVKIQGALPLAADTIIGVTYALWKVRRPSRIEIKPANCNTVIEVVFGDLFKQEGVRAIPVNEFFDSKIGNPVSPKSVHGAFIERVFGGRSESFDKQVDEQLRDVPHHDIKREEGKSKQYPIGSTALITANQDRYLAFASTRTDPKTCKASADVAIMWLGMQELWRRARIVCNGQPLNVPLVGSGMAGIGLPPRSLVDLMILSVITETKSTEITRRIRIVLYGDRFDFPDLRDIAARWGG